MLAITRFRVPDPTAFQARVENALTVWRTRAGFETADLVRNLDDDELWALVTRWRDVGSYRRALQGYESKVVVVPLLSEALDEPSAYEDPELL
jgi:heme-degrading monooxygenase HmoA